MSGWQRIGAVISVLWVLGAPIYLVVEMSQHAIEFYADCRRSRHVTMTLDEADQYCREFANQKSEPSNLSELGHMLVAGDFDTVALWAIILLPVALLWLIGGVIFATVRWVWRGFVRN